MADTHFLPRSPIQVNLRSAMRAGQNAVVSDLVEVVYSRLFGRKPAVKLEKRHVYFVSILISDHAA
jgi:hypothetical protein